MSDHKYYGPRQARRRALTTQFRWGVALAMMGIVVPAMTGIADLVCLPLGIWAITASLRGDDLTE